MIGSLFLLVLSIAVLLLSTQVFIVLAKRLSLFLKLSPLIVGVTVVSIGTSLPELTVSTVAILRHDPGLAMGNIIGSNIINVFLVLGVGVLAGKLHLGTTKTQRNAYLLLAVTGLFLLLYGLEIFGLVGGVILLSLAILVTVGEYFLGGDGSLT